MKWLVSFCVGLGFLAGTASAEDLKLSKYPKVYKGEEGVEVTVAQVMPEDKNLALIKVTGIDHDIDGKVFLHQIQVQGRAQAYVITVDGTERTRMRADDGYWYKQYELYLPNSIKAVSVWYDEKLSKKADAAALLKAYNKDKALQEKMAKFDRKANEARHNTELAKVDADTNKTCGSSIKTTIDWPTVKDEVLQKYSIYSYCGEVSDRFDSLCRDSNEGKVAAKKVKKVTCKFASKLKLSRAGDHITLEVEPETGNQEDFVSAYLKNEF
jgi:hypothetical protein